MDRSMVNRRMETNYLTKTLTPISSNLLAFFFIDRKVGENKTMKKDILPLINPIIVTALSSVSHVINRNRRFYNFQVFGFDFILDCNLRPWLIEVNSNPCIEESSPIL